MQWLLAEQDLDTRRWISFHRSSAIACQRLFADLQRQAFNIRVWAGKVSENKRVLFPNYEWIQALAGPRREYRRLLYAGWAGSTRAAERPIRGPEKTIRP